MIIEFLHNYLPNYHTVNTLQNYDNLYHNDNYEGHRLTYVIGGRVLF